MFSDRFARHPQGLNPQWEAKLAREASGQPVIDLTASNPTVAGLAYPEGIPALFDNPDLLRYHPSPRGSPTTRAAIAGYYATRQRVCRSDDLILTASTSEAYSFLFKLLCDPGDEVLIPSPTYPLFDALAELEHVKLVRYPLRLQDDASRWFPDMEFLRASLSTRCKALILVNPNNPTGHLADAGEIRGYLALAADYGLSLIVDEVFSEYVLGARPFLPIESEGPLVFTLNGFSKLLGLPQLKLGWIHVAGAEAAAQSALDHLEWIADAFLSVNGPVQTVAGELLKVGPSIRTTIRKRLSANLACAENLASGPVRLRKPEAGWYLVLDIALADDDEEFALRLLREEGVHVHAGSLFGFEEGCRVVVSLLAPEAEFELGFQRLLACAVRRTHA